MAQGAHALWWPREVGCRGGGRKLSEGGGTSYWWPMHVVIRQKPTQHCKAIILQLKKTTKKKKQGLKKVTPYGHQCSLKKSRHWTLVAYFIKERKESEVAYSCLTLCVPMDCSLPGSSIRGIFQDFLLQGVFLTQGSNPRLQHCRLYHLSHGKPLLY